MFDGSRQVGDDYRSRRRAFFALRDRTIDERAAVRVSRYQ